MPTKTTEVFNSSLDKLIAPGGPEVVTLALPPSAGLGNVISTAIQPKHTILDMKADGTYDVWNGTGTYAGILLEEFDPAVNTSVLALVMGAVYEQFLVYNRASVTVGNLIFGGVSNSIIIIDQSVNN